MSVVIFFTIFAKVLKDTRDCLCKKTRETYKDMLYDIQSEELRSKIETTRDVLSKLLSLL